MKVHQVRPVRVTANAMPWGIERALRLIRLSLLAMLVHPVASGIAADVLPWSKGTVLPPTLETLDGQRIDPATLAGKTVVINFWAVWCAACREELPAIEKMANSLKGKPVEVLLVNVGDPRSAIDKFFTKKPLGMPTLRFAQNLTQADAWQFQALPATVVIDPRGQPRWLVRGSVDAQAEPLRDLVARVMRPS